MKEEEVQRKGERSRVWRRGSSRPFYFEPLARLGQQLLPITTRKSIVSIGDQLSYMTKYAADQKMGVSRKYRFGEEEKEDDG